MTVQTRPPAKPAPRLPATAFFANAGADPLTDAFHPRHGAHAATGARPVPAGELAARWQTLAATPRTGRSVAYVHIPFCANHCLFCGFYQNPWRVEAGAPYVDRLIDQMAAGVDTAMQRGHPLRAVYLGGGTPTALAAADLGRLIRALRRHLPLAPDCEITVEGRVFDFGAEKAAAAFDAGATRISLGVQSFDDRLRRLLGRKTSGAEVRRFLAGLVAMDRGAIVIDLIYGLPGQTPALWQADLDAATGLGLDGVDLYSLKLIAGTPLLSALEKGKRQPVPASALGAFYAQGAAHMARAGWEAISCTHWRRGTRERNAYNLEVKTGAACLAFGAGAGGNHAGHSWRCLPDLRAWEAEVAAGRPAVAGLLQAQPLQPLIDAIRAGMELGRLDLPATDAACAALTGTGFAALAGAVDPAVDVGRADGTRRPAPRAHAGRTLLAGGDDPAPDRLDPPGTGLRDTLIHGGDPMTHPTAASAAIRAALAAAPEAAIEDIAAAAGVPPGAVLDHLPAGEVALAPGAAFVEVMQDLAGWGEVTVVLNTGAIIFEAKGEVPVGRLGHGFYNLHGGPIGGHFRAEACARIAFISRRFMGVETHSVQFHTAGACMFKVYLGRDSERRMRPDQITRFAALRDRLAAPEAV